MSQNAARWRSGAGRRSNLYVGITSYVEEIPDRGACQFLSFNNLQPGRLPLVIRRPKGQS